MIAVGFLMAEATEHGRQEVPRRELRDHRLAGAGHEEQAHERRGPAVQGAGGRLPRRLPRPGSTPRTNSATSIGSVGGQKIPPVDHYIAGYQAGAKAADPEIKTLNGYSQDFVDQAKCKEIALDQISKGVEGRLPGRRPVRPRRPRRGQGEERPGHRRRRRPGLPRPAGPHQRAEEGRRRRVQRDQGRPGRPVQGRAPTSSPPSRPAAWASASSTPTAEKYADQVKQVQDKIAAERDPSIPDTVAK